MEHKDGGGCEVPFLFKGMICRFHVGIQEIVYFNQRLNDGNLSMDFLLANMTGKSSRYGILLGWRRITGS